MEASALSLVGLNFTNIHPYMNLRMNAALYSTIFLKTLLDFRVSRIIQTGTMPTPDIYEEH